MPGTAALRFHCVKHGALTRLLMHLQGDPIMTGFDGELFEFEGEVCFLCLTLPLGSSVTCLPSVGPGVGAACADESAACAGRRHLQHPV